MSVAVIIGIGIAVFILTYIMFNLKSNTADGRNHFLLQLLLFFFIIAGLLLLGKATMDSSSNCDWVTNSTTVVGNTTTYVHSYSCVDSTNNTSFTFYKLTLWFTRLVALYIFLHFTWYMLTYLGWVVPK
jgi:hypothetical protein